MTGPATIVADPGSDEPLVSVSGASAALTIQPISDQVIHLGSLTLANGGSAEVSRPNAATFDESSSIAVVLGTGDDSSPVLSIDSSNGSTLGLEDNDLIVRQGAADPSSYLAGVSVQSPGTFAIGTLAPADYEQNTLPILGLGGEGPIAPLQLAIGTQSVPVDPGDMLVKYTYVGPAAPIESAPGEASSTTSSSTPSASLDSPTPASGMASPGFAIVSSDDLAPLSLSGITPADVTSVVINGNIPALAGVQRSMVNSIVYTFSEAVTLNATTAFSIAVSTGQTGTVPTLSWSAISPDGGGASTQWAVTFSGSGVTGGSIGDGVYDLTLDSAAVTSEANPAVAAQPHNTDTFYRFFGDAQGTGRVVSADNNAFQSTYGLKSTDPGYLAYFADDGTNKIDSADYNAFLNNYGKRLSGLLSFNPAALEPTSVAATVNGSTSVTISWTAPANAVVSSYSIQRWSVADQAWESLAQNLSGSATSYTDTTAQPNTAYEYQVAAQVSGRMSDWSLSSNDVLTAPGAQISGPGEVTEGSPYVLDLTASSTGSTYTVQNWVISYGDGATHVLSGDPATDLYTYNNPSSPTDEITATVYATEDGVTYTASASMAVTVDEATASLYLSPDSSAAVGQPFNLYQDLTDGGVHTLSGYSVAWGDGSSDSDSTTPESITGGYADAFSHTYAATGTYDVSATAVTEQGTVTATTAVAVVPVSVAGSTNGYVAGQEYDLTPTFDDPGHTISGYVVSWGDGSANSTYSASATSFGHDYAAGGQTPYEATVQAIADDGTWTAYAEIDPLAAVWPDNGATVSRGDTVNLDGSFDANGDEPTSWFVNWGDGTTATYAGSNDENFNGGSGVGGPLNATHSYSSDGAFTIAAIASDAIGTYVAQPATIEVDEPTPTFSVDGSNEFTRNQEYDLTPTFSISSGDTPTNYFVSWGDGSDEATYSGSSTVLAHTFTSGAGAPFTAAVTVTTDFGTYTDSISVDEVPATPSISGPDSVTAGQTATFTTSFDDPNGNTPTGWTVYWGDSATGESVSGNPGVLTHVYDASPEGGGDWTVAAMASDSDGQYWANDATVAVTNDSPSLSLTSDATATAGIDYGLTESFTDPEGRTPYNWLVNWGDSASNVFYNGNPGTFWHVYTLPGSYQVNATAVVAPTDPASTTNASYSTSFSLAVGDAGSLTFNVDAVVEGRHSQAEVDFTDPDGVVPTLYTINWGDGTDSYGRNPDYGNVFGHTYTHAGSYVATAVASTIEGDFTATQAVSVPAADPGLELDAAFWADGGQPFPVAAYFASDLAYHLTSQFPVPGASINYTVNWGDGATASYTDNQFSHVYTYLDPNTYSNAYEITVVATGDDGNYTATAGASVGVQQPDGSGSITAGSAPSGVTEGQAATVNASFSDPQQTTQSEFGGRWLVSWGDGSSDGGLSGLNTQTSYAPTHTYTEPGEYSLTYAVEYNEIHSGNQDAGYVAFSSGGVVDVAEATPALSATATASTLTAGDVYALHLTYTDTVGDHVPNVLTVDWGDNSESIYEAASQPEPWVSHVYATAGTYVPSLSLTAFKDDGHIAATAGAVDVIEPTVGIVATVDTAYQHGQQPGSFDVTRTGADFDVPLTVSYAAGGTLESSAYVVTDQNGQILDGTATIPAGSVSAELFVYPLEDQTPRWTDTVDVTLSSGGANYAVNTAAPAAGCYVVSDDLYAWLDNGSDNQIVQGDDGDVTNATMVPLVLDLPENSQDGDVISLDYSVPTEANVWMHQTPGSGDQPVLGMVDGAPVSEVTWTVGTDDDAPSGLTTLWVEPTGGSANVNDIYFNVSDSDAAATKPTLPQYPPPSPPSPPAPPAPTTANSTSVNGLTGLTLHIVEEDSNTTRGAGANVEGVTQNWLVGQIVDLKAVIGGPAQFVRGTSTVAWTVPGNVLADYVDSNEKGATTALAASSLLGAGNPTGTAQQEVKFFWVATTQPTESEQVTATLSLAGLSGPTFPATTTFNVEEPQSSFEVTEQGSTTLHDFGEVGVTNPAVELGNLLARSRGTRAPIDGIEITGAATIPTNLSTFGQGKWEVIQLATPDRTGQATYDGVAYNNLHLPVNGQLGLDYSDPYDIYLDANGISTPLEVAVFSTGTVESMADIPSEYLMQHLALPNHANPVAVPLTRLNVEDNFEDYQMFKPPGDGRWVPLNYQDWAWDVTVTQDAQGKYVYVGSPVGPEPGDPQPGFQYEPQWSRFFGPGGAPFEMQV